jgi:hypothetical protein
MRYLVCFVILLGPLAGPLTASAQGDDSGQAAESADTPRPERGVHRWHPDAFVDPATGATLEDGGKPDFEIEYATQSKAPAPRTAQEEKVRRAKIGLSVSIVPVLVGGMMALAASGPIIPFSDGSDGSSSDSGGDAVTYAGAAVAAAGAAAMIATGILLGVRKRKLRESKEATDRKVRWDLAQSRIMF